MTSVLPRLPRALLLALAGTPLVLALAAPDATAGTAAAAAAVPTETCEELDLNDEDAVVERADAVDDVFVGRVDAVVRRGAAGGEGRVGQPPPGSTGSPTDGGTTPPRSRVITHRVTVTTVLAGDLQLGQKVIVVFDPSDQGRNRLLGQRETHLFFTSDVSGELRADYCDGSQVLPGGLSAPLQRTLEDYLSAPEAPSTVALERPSGGAEEPPRLSRVLAPGAAISLIGVLGLFLLSRLARHRG